MPAGEIRLPADSTGKRLQTTAVTVDGVEVHRQHMVPTTDRSVEGVYITSSFRLVGAASSPTNLMTIQNTTGATKNIGVRRIAVDVSVSGTTAYLVTSYFRVWHLTGVTPTGGTLATKHRLDSSMPASQANTEIRFAASADGTASAITHALPAGNPSRQAAHPAVLTGVGQWLTDELIIQDLAMDPLVLHAGETLLLALVGNSATTMHYTVETTVEEFVS